MNHDPRRRLSPAPLVSLICMYHGFHYISKFVLDLTNSTCDMSNIGSTFNQLDSLQFSADDARIPRTIPQCEKFSTGVRNAEFTPLPDAPDHNIHDSGITSRGDTSIGVGSVDSETSLASDINPVDQAWFPSTNHGTPNTSLYQSIDHDLPSQSALSVNNVADLWDFNLLSIPNDMPHSIALSKLDSVGQEAQRSDINSWGAPEDSSSTGWLNGIDSMPNIEAYVSAQTSLSNVFQVEETVPDLFPMTSIISDGETGSPVLKVDKPKR
jgi:hypothetical protein